MTRLIVFISAALLAASIPSAVFAADVPVAPPLGGN